MSSQAIPGTTASSTTKGKVLSLKVKRAILDEEITAEADIDAVAADGAAAVTSLGQLWEAADNANLVRSGLDYLDFALADQDLFAMEELTTDQLAASVSEKGTAADSSSSDGEGDNDGAPQPGTAGAALAAVNTLRMYLCTEPGSCDLMDKVEQRVLKLSKTAVWPSWKWFII
ncbi:hypothetical protein HPB52_002164 [Rhipicephalus sanguineus]|uniref:Uncharacterized protein n=1 Tax=Rhipicephalus sanguineus TaxID=34632 RepID=A0A9D4T4V9_RHISA|nr:hypothetical protein HPB52_002164 [Rhipicephalus sanguineus]